MKDLLHAHPKSWREALLLMVFALAATAGVGCAGGNSLPNLHVVDAGVLLRGGQPDARGLATLRDRYGVRTVINLNDSTTDDELVTSVALGLDYLPLPINTSRLPRERLLAFLKAVEDAKAAGRVPVFVHCQFGQDRTGASVGVYRVVADGWTAERAVAEKNQYQDWLHRLFLPQVSRRIEQAAEERQAWQDDLDALPPTPFVRPPVAATRLTSRPAA